MAEYTRMHGAGNCFVLVDNTDNSIDENCMSSLAIKLCSKEIGYGLDGMIELLPAENKDCDFRMMFFNSDGSQGEMCGNAARCVSRFGYEQGYAPNGDNIRIKTTAGLVTGRRITEELYEVRLNDPSIADMHRAVTIDGETYDCAYVELGKPGIPHAVVEMPLEEIGATEKLRSLGRELRNSPAFPKGANVTFYAFTDENSIKAITYERGVENFTLACGTGCGASAVSLSLRGTLQGSNLKIAMPGGNLSVSFTRNGDIITDILLTGPTAYII